MSAEETKPSDPPEENPSETEITDAPPAVEPEKEPDAPESPETPEASATKLTVFERGKLRATGMGNLISRLETTEGQLHAAHGKIKTLEAENARLTAGREAEEKTAREEIDKAAKGRENEVSQGVREKLSTLGVPETDAPAASSEAEDKTLTRAEFEQLDYEARNAFIREHGKIVS